MGQMAAAVLILAAGCGPAGEPADRSTALTLVAADGMKIAATEHGAAVTPSPGLILVHMFGSDRGVWAAFAARAQREGYAVIAIDMRGHGDSAALNPDAPKYRQFATSDWLNVLQDIEAARVALVKAGTDPDRIGVVGASIGANLATAYASEHGDIAALVLLSPGRDYKGIEITGAFERYGKRPSLLVTTEGDRYAADTSRALHRSATGFSELREFAGMYHGTEMLDAIPNAMIQILQWCDTVLVEAPRSAS